MAGMALEVLTYGDPAADMLLIQMVDDHDLEVIEKETAHIKELTGGQNFCLKAVRVNSWNTDLSPWPAPAVFGSEGFGEGASHTLEKLLREIIPDILSENNEEKTEEKSGDLIFEESMPKKDSGAYGGRQFCGKKIYLGGYSLAGLFALWAGYQTDFFEGIAAASPSIWFPGFTDYMRDNTLRTGAVYLSLGDREERTKNPLMSQVGNAIRDGYAILRNAGINCTLEWNKGNHFKNPDLRTAKAFAWLMTQTKE